MISTALSLLLYLHAKNPYALARSYEIGAIYRERQAERRVEFQLRDYRRISKP